MENYTIVKALNEHRIIADRKADGKRFFIEDMQIAGIPNHEKQKIVWKMNCLVQKSESQICLPRYHHPFIENGKLFCVYDYLGDVTLETKIVQALKTKTSFKEEFIWEVVTAIAVGILNFHTNNPPASHGNIYAKNIYFVDDHDIRLGGFSLTEPDPTSQTPIQADIYQIGSLLYEISSLTKFKPEGKHFRGNLEKLPRSIRNTIKKLIKFDCNEQLTVSQILEIPEVAVHFLTLKLRADIARNEEEKRKVVELQAEIELCKKRLNIE